MSRRKQLKPKAMKVDEPEDESMNRHVEEEEEEEEESTNRHVEDEEEEEEELSDVDGQELAKKRTKRSLSIESTMSISSTSSFISCQLCEERFSNVAHLQTHTLIAHSAADLKTNGNMSSPSSDTGLLVCGQCDASFNSMINFASHMRINHLAIEKDNDILSLTCRFCSDVLPDSQTRLLHVVDHFSLKQLRLQCIDCPSVLFENDTQLKCHQNEIHLETIHRCRICLGTFERRVEAQEHLMVNHGTQCVHFCCKLCRIGFDTREQLVVHVQLIHDRCNETGITFPLFRQQSRSLSTRLRVEIRLLKCIVCDEQCESEEHLDQHRLQHCAIGISDQCVHCRETINNMDQFAEHCRRHSRGLTLTCVICRQSLCNDNQMAFHARFHIQTTKTSDEQGDGSSLSSIKCHLCQTNVNEGEEELNVHLIEHNFTGQSRSILCPHCDSTFTSARTLLDHVDQQHTDQIPPYFCHHCHNRFHFRSQLDHHLFQHETRHHDMPISMINTNSNTFFSCPKCEKRFNSLNALQGHSHIHMTNRVHRCDFCTLSFSTMNRLSNHRRKHFGTRNFKCQICDVKFSRRDLLIEHMAGHNGNLRNCSQLSVSVSASTTTAQENQ